MLRWQVFEHDRAAWHLHKKVRLGRYDQSKSLQGRRHVNFRVDNAVTASLDFTQVVDLAVWRNGPDHIGRVDSAQLRRARHVLDAQLDACAPAARSSDFCFAS